MLLTVYSLYRISYNRYQISRQILTNIPHMKAPGIAATPGDISKPALPTFRCIRDPGRIFAPARRKPYAVVAMVAGSTDIPDRLPGIWSDACSRGYWSMMTAG